MSELFQIMLPFPPSVNHYWKTVVRCKNGHYFPHTYRSDTGRIIVESPGRAVVTIERMEFGQALFDKHEAEDLKWRLTNE